MKNEKIIHHTPEELSKLAEINYQEFYNLAKEYYIKDNKFYVEIIRPILNKVNKAKKSVKNNAKIDKPSSLSIQNRQYKDINKADDKILDKMNGIIFCTNCGIKNDTDSNYCFYCGNILTKNNLNIKQQDSTNIENKGRVSSKENNTSKYNLEELKRIQSLEKRSGCLVPWLYFLLVCSVIGFIVVLYALGNEKFLFQSIQNVNISKQTIKDAMAGLVLIDFIILIGLIGMLKWQRWGFIFYLIGSLGNLIINASIGINAAIILIGLAYPIITLFLIFNKWEFFE